MSLNECREFIDREVERIIAKCDSGALIFEIDNTEYAREIFIELKTKATALSSDVVFVLDDDSGSDMKKVRELKYRISRKGYGKRFFLIKNVHSLRSEAANALLKSIEEPPLDTYFLMTAKPHSVLATIKSRSIVARVGNLSPKETAVSESGRNLAEIIKSIEPLSSSEIKTQLEEFVAAKRNAVVETTNNGQAQILKNALELLRKQNISKIEIQNIILQWEKSTTN
ncbi:hypothetical protein ACFL2D_02105 [Patescibacteria group bacterium]